MYLRIFFSLLLLFFVFCVHAQENSFVTSSISKPTDLPLNGWNKVLKLRNGNTMVLHLRLNEKMRVKMFDSSLNEIASQSEYFKILGEKNLSGSSFVGLYDIGGYPTLFITQSIDHHYSLLRIRFDPVTGKLFDEIIAYETGMRSVGEFFVSKSQLTDEYAVMWFNPHNLYSEKSTARILYYDENHKVKKTSNLYINEPHLMDLDYCGFNYDPQHGTYITLTGRDVSRSVKDQIHKVIYCGALPDDTGFTVRKMLFSDGFMPNHSIIRHNDFSGVINMTISGFYIAEFDIGNLKQKRVVLGSFFVVLNRNNFELQTIKPIKYRLGNEYITAANSTGKKHEGFPMRMFVNNYGVPIVISEQHRMPLTLHHRELFMTDMGDICITKFDDDGEEISGVVIPKRQIVMNALYPAELAIRETHKYLFRDIRSEAADNQFPSFEYLPTKQYNYLFFNDYPSNFGKNLSKSFDTVGYYDRTEAICYQVNRQDELHTQYLFGKPEKDQSRAILLESICEFVERKELLALVQVRTGKESRLHLARCWFQ